jgi:hypothetical protein
LPKVAEFDSCESQHFRNRLDAKHPHQHDKAIHVFPSVVGVFGTVKQTPEVA